MKIPIVEAQRLTTEEEDIENIIALLHRTEIKAEEADNQAKKARREIDKLRAQLLIQSSRLKKTTSGESSTTLVWCDTGYFDSSKKRKNFVKDIVRIRKYSSGAFAGRSEGIVLGTTRKGDQLVIGFEDTDNTTIRSPHTCTVIGRQK